MSAEAAEARVIPEWSLGDRLRKVRRVTGMSQAEFAAQLGRNQKTYASWELDMTAPRNVVAVAKRIEAMTGVPAGWLLDTGVLTEGYLPPKRHLVAVDSQVAATQAVVTPRQVASNSKFGCATADVLRTRSGGTAECAAVA